MSGSHHVLSSGSHKTVKFVVHCKDYRTERLFSLVLHWQNILDWQALGLSSFNLELKQSCGKLKKIGH